jgi:uncharacterized protein
MGDTSTLKSLDPSQFVDERFGLPTVRDILLELEKPGRDPRPQFKTATFAEGIHDIKDLKPGMMLEGTVTNVANFGAFVDIGVHQDGLVHVSQLSDRFVKDPSALVKAGDVVKVRVVEVDLERKRIALSMRKDDVASRRTTVASSEVAANKNRIRQKAPNQAKSMPEGALGAALSEALRRK